MGVHLSVDPNPVHQAEIATVRADIWVPRGGQVDITFDTGDGRVHQSSQFPPCTGAANLIATELNAWRAATAYQLTVKVMLFDCAQKESFASDALSLSVQPGDVVTNGPFQPSIVNLHRVPPGGDPGDPNGPPPAQVWIAFGVGDIDGYSKSVFVDWGDGTQPDAHTVSLQYCQDTPTTWPSWGPFSSGEGFAHQYASAGTYHVTATVRTSGCDGQDVQSAVQTIDIVWSP